MLRDVGWSRARKSPFASISGWRSQACDISTLCRNFEGLSCKNTRFYSVDTVIYLDPFRLPSIYKEKDANSMVSML